MPEATIYIDGRAVRVSQRTAETYNRALASIESSQQTQRAATQSLAGARGSQTTAQNTVNRIEEQYRNRR